MSVSRAHVSFIYSAKVIDPQGRHMAKQPPPPPIEQELSRTKDSEREEGMDGYRQGQRREPQKLVERERNRRQKNMNICRMPELSSV